MRRIVAIWLVDASNLCPGVNYYILFLVEMVPVVFIRVAVTPHLRLLTVSHPRSTGTSFDIAFSHFKMPILSSSSGSHQELFAPSKSQLSHAEYASVFIAPFLSYRPHRFEHILSTWRFFFRTKRSITFPPGHADPPHTCLPFS